MTLSGHGVSPDLRFESVTEHSSSFCGFTTPSQYRCNGNCECFVAAETFGVTIDVIRDGSKRRWFLRYDERCQNDALTKADIKTSSSMSV